MNINILKLKNNIDSVGKIKKIKKEFLLIESFLVIIPGIQRIIGL